MLKQHSEIRMIWLMVLIISAVGSWFLKLPIMTFLCIIAFVFSVMQYVDAIEKATHNIARQTHSGFQTNSKVPLYLSSMIAVLGSLLDWYGVVGLAASSWIFFFLRWLRTLEQNLNRIQSNQHLKQPEHIIAANLIATDQSINRNETADQTAELGFIDQIKFWIFQGNPVLKVAVVVLVVGLILLLRFATEHWQLSLSLKLAMVAAFSLVLTVFGFTLQSKNRSFSLAVEGLGLAGLFLTLFFAYYTQLITSLAWAAVCYVVVMAVTLRLSLWQQSVELALMAMLIAYIAPFTLPIRDATAVELVAYYLVVNLAVAILSTLRPWKMLNQIAFLATSCIAGSYAFMHGYAQERDILTLLLIAHIAIFTWLGFRFSQLMAKQDIQKFGLNPILDIALIFSAPIIGYLFIYLMYFDEITWQAGISFSFAIVFAMLYQLAKNNQSMGLISQSYLSLSLIFLALIPPILLPEQWSVSGWAVESVLIFAFALYRHSTISRYLAFALLIMAGLSSVDYWIESTEFPSTMYWILSLSYLAVVIMANLRADFRQQLSLSNVIFLSLLSGVASTLQLILWLDYFTGAEQAIFSLVLVVTTYLLINEFLLNRKAHWTWSLPKWFGLIPLMVFALWLILSHIEDGVLHWLTIVESLGFAASGLMLAWLWFRSLLGVHSEREWVSLGVLISLGFSSLCLIPSMPYLSVVILPVLFMTWSGLSKRNVAFNFVAQTRSSLLLTLSWMICSQLFSQQAFQGYIFPLLNPFDLVSLGILALFIWMLRLQLKAGLEQSIVAILMVIGLLWLSSYIALRGLHVYFQTPYNDLMLWGNAVVQLSLTLLWVCLALITMSFSTRKKIRSMWILGGSILLIVTLKLVLLDLSHVGTLTRVVSFLGAGFVMLVIAYIAPMPELDNKQSLG